MGSLGGEQHGLEVSSLTHTFSASCLGSTSRPELVAWSGICMKLNPTLLGQNPVCCQGKRPCWGSPELTMIRWEKTGLLQKTRTPAASTCCQPRGKASTCCLKTWGLEREGADSKSQTSPPLSAFPRSPVSAQVPGRCEAPLSHTSHTGVRSD